MEREKLHQPKKRRVRKKSDEKEIKIKRSNIKSWILTSGRDKKFLIRLLLYVQIVICYSENRKNYPSCERVERVGTNCGTSACSCHFTSRRGSCKRRRLGQPLDRAKRNGAARCGTASPVDRSRHEGEVCANIISVVLRRESFHIERQAKAYVSFARLAG